MFESAKIDDSVWDSRHGWGKVVGVFRSNLLPLKVLFGLDGETKQRSYRFDGRFKDTDVSPRLFWNSFIIPVKAFIKPLPKLKVDTKVIVWNKDKTNKRNRYFSHFNQNGKIVCFQYGATSWSHYNNNKDYWDTWDNWELAEEES